MFTRGTLAHNRTWGASAQGLAAPPVAGWQQGIVVRGGAIPVVLPPPVVMMDPSNSATWTRPVRWT